MPGRLDSIPNTHHGSPAQPARLPPNPSHHPPVMWAWLADWRARMVSPPRPMMRPTTAAGHSVVMLVSSSAIRARMSDLALATARLQGKVEGETDGGAKGLGGRPDAELDAPPPPPTRTNISLQSSTGLALQRRLLLPANRTQPQSDPPSAHAPPARHTGAQYPLTAPLTRWVR